MRLGVLIIEKGINDYPNPQKRHTVRAIILNKHHHILMVYSNLFDDYTFPGGGIKPFESKEEALKRELKEELGATDLSIKSYVGYTEEIRYGLKNNDKIFHQFSDFYLVEIHEFGPQELMERELWHGLEPRWMNIFDVIKHNEMIKLDERHQQKGLKTVMERELIILNKLMEMIDNEKI
ncbi:MAG: hypothetical protein A2Y45_07235 [Tenericutes bacterium GWC2_34_14]|nr:MAG: hypothetical protein A2Z84_04500 [Tenericutes bacterium GWA2_35_7]OHE29702.1 MAG: hypothetical protein A2Y45_07235 [Tenericutes bacterium GWC2_34_14]OHE34681.1 MAG: hypothetical protein A2012_00845 [Tenericutes bacterium GWE2_34_108]OHE37458.1 MAG: hypothetical protein A2Y46_02165 [Tenericutes bacterium GWF1_35_14]OHE39407.1 MAG: hypothetical protein A2Y44_00695 [Tenericutes bacterium GWF2_35_184]OHE43630.1 MAG: hypothetical protein A3K26_00235 [Tenericutes bacterium RIFOXYA12_FULL_35_